MHLFVYNYERPWPPTLDFAPALLAFTVVATVLTGLLIVPAARRHAATLLLAVGVLFTAWSVNVYLVAAAPHWGQRETIATYYRRRQGPRSRSSPTSSTGRARTSTRATGSRSSCRTATPSRPTWRRCASGAAGDLRRHGAPPGKNLERDLGPVSASSG
jgi:hypothetical protein